MVIDFHVHGKITKKFPFDEEKFLLMVKEAKENGMNALAITEHLNANNFMEGYEFLKNNFNNFGDYYDIDGFKVFYGMEVTTKQDLDFLIIGNSKLVLELRNKIIENIKTDKFIDVNDLFKLNISNELLVIWAHPYRNHSELPLLESYITEKLDALEVNSKDAYKFGKDEMQEKIYMLAKQLNLPIVKGSDTHYFIQISTAKNIFSKNCNTIKEIKEEIKTRNYSSEFSSELNVRVKSAKIIKDLICNKSNILWTSNLFIMNN